MPPSGIPPQSQQSQGKPGMPTAFLAPFLSLPDRSPVALGYPSVHLAKLECRAASRDGSCRSGQSWKRQIPAPKCRRKEASLP